MGLSSCAEVRTPEEWAKRFHKSIVTMPGYANAKAGRVGIGPTVSGTFNGEPWIVRFFLSRRTRQIAVSTDGITRTVLAILYDACHAGSVGGATWLPTRQ